MLDPKKQIEMDQSRTFLVEHLPPLWRGLFLKCMEEGFTEVDALKLVRTFILSQSIGSVGGVDG